MLRNVRDILAIIVSLLVAKEWIHDITHATGYDAYGYFVVISVIAIGILTIIERKMIQIKKQKKANHDKKFKLYTLK